jgi:hypothetical protein
MMATKQGIADHVAEPPGGLLSVEESMKRAVSSPPRRPVNALADMHHLADTDPAWAGGDARRLRHLASAVTPSAVHPVLGLIGMVPGPVAAAVRTGLDTVIGMVPKVSPA